MPVKKSIVLTFSFLVCFSIIETNGQVSAVTIKKGNSGWQLLVSGHPFYVKGVVGDSYLEKIKENGGNSIRTGSKKEQLDNVSNLKLNALGNLPARAERDGMNYNDTSEIRKQTEKIITIIERIKNHPAVFMWVIGNELDYIPPLSEKDFIFNVDTLILPFYGNKAEVIAEKSGIYFTDSLKVFVDG